MSERNAAASLGMLAPDASIVVDSGETTVEAFRDGAPLALVFLRHLR